MDKILYDDVDEKQKKKMRLNHQYQNFTFLQFLSVTKSLFVGFLGIWMS